MFWPYVALYGVRNPNPTPGCWEWVLVLADMCLVKVRNSITKEEGENRY